MTQRLHAPGVGIWLARARDDQPESAVGAVLRREGAVVGEGFHTYAGRSTPRFWPSKRPAKPARGATLYISLEPCGHQGAPALHGSAHRGGRRRWSPPWKIPTRASPERACGVSLPGVEVALAQRVRRRGRVDQRARSYTHAHRGRSCRQVRCHPGWEDRPPGTTTGWITSEAARAHVRCCATTPTHSLPASEPCWPTTALLTDRSGLDRSRPLSASWLDSHCAFPIGIPHGGQRPLRRGGGYDLGRLRRPPPCGWRTPASAVWTLGRRRRPGQPGGVVERLAAYPGYRDDRSGSKVNWTALESGVADKIFFYYAPKILGGLQSIPVAGELAAAAGRTPSACAA